MTAAGWSRSRVHNDTGHRPIRAPARAEALHALAALHPRSCCARTTAASSRRSTQPRATNVNTWPVLATPDDDAVLGAAIVLPDHPQLAPESRGNLFDNTEIEEALLLHVHALTDAEREEIAASRTRRCGR